MPTRVFGRIYNQTFPIAIHTYYICAPEWHKMSFNLKLVCSPSLSQSAELAVKVAATAAAPGTHRVPVTTDQVTTRGCFADKYNWDPSESDIH